MARQRVPMVVLGVAGLLVAIGLVLSWSSPGARMEREREAKLAAAASVDGAAVASATRAATSLVVDAFRAEQREARVVVDIDATLEARRTVKVGAEVSGRVVEVAAEEHTNVAAGALLVRLDLELPAAAVRRTRAALLRARSSHELASQEAGRQRTLSGEGISSQADTDRTETEEEVSDAALAEARAQFADAETRLAKTSIVAPFAGVVSELDLEPGAFVRTGDGVARVSDLSEIEIEVGVNDRQILALREGEPVRVAVDAYPGDWFEGRIHRLGRTPDPVTRKYPVPIRVPNPEERLLPGMLGRVRFELGPVGTTLRIPRRVVFREFEVDFLYVLDVLDASAGAAEGALLARVERRRVEVRPVAFRPDLVDIESGLVAGDWVASSGIRELRDGIEVQVRALERAWGLP